LLSLLIQRGQQQLEPGVVEGAGSGLPGARRCRAAGARWNRRTSSLRATLAVSSTRLWPGQLAGPALKHLAG
jgi:hypothetical protein